MPHINIDLVSLAQGASVTGFLAVVIEQFFALRRRQSTEQRILKVELKAQADPERVSYAWDVARLKLESYFDRNLSQVNAIFWVSITAMGVGFGFIVWGVARSFTVPSILPGTYVAVGSGIITEFVGLTFMAIYRSTLRQANSYMSVLERINAVGMAVQISESIDKENHALRNETRAEVVRLLLEMSGASPRRKESTQRA